MHDEILDENQVKLLDLIREFGLDFGLVGGTAIALHLGHRRSIDFDLFMQGDFDSEKIKQKIKKKYQIQRVFVEKPGELTLVVKDVKFTFYKYPFDIKFSLLFKDIIKIPDLTTLASMKAYALGRRAKWKDYVDLYFILKQIDLNDITKQANLLFGGEFNEKLLREQMSYFNDIDYSEEVDYLEGFAIDPEEIKKFLTKISLQR